MNTNEIDNTTVEVATGQGDSAPVDESTVEQSDAPAEGDGGGNREAAKYRRQLREAEAQRDALSERLSTLQRREAERLAAEHLADGADMWRDGLDIAALLDDDGNLDPAKVADAAGAIGRAHRHWAAPRPQKRNPTGRGGGLKSGATGSDDYRPATSWQKILNPRLGDD
ncbi:hypothetical protein BST11_15365 [Mycobacterium alsense]|uniref:Scaffolding protein n=1 Tax=Mycobacterium alsense TaxID=324058 RepID=A0AA42C0B4_9MYCO|nr:hypothetical protein [Mycobacterium alsense]MCV7379959.1 hypothetical protein [Mycobacterium alsense]OQZ89951.1 hypothetical protein BST11_15365 [Mycobacterium alsense]